MAEIVQNFKGDETLRERLKHRVAIAQKIIRVHATAAIETTTSGITAKETLGSSYVMPDPEGEPFEKIPGSRV